MKITPKNSALILKTELNRTVRGVNDFFGFGFESTLNRK